MEWVALSSSETFLRFTSDHFWSAIRVWVERPHIVNRRIIGIEPIEAWNVEVDKKKFESPNTAINVFKLLQKINTHPTDVTTLKPYLSIFSKAELCNHIWTENHKLILQLRKVLPKQPNKFQHAKEILLLDREQTSVVFLPVQREKLDLKFSTSYTYRLKLENERIVLHILSAPQETEILKQASVEWLKTCVLPKIIRWASDTTSKNTIFSLSAISLSRYSENYHHLKAKYGPKFVKMWTECTDPLKYVYEDIAISAYLITLWEQENEDLNLDNKQSFVDLGCGNGFLVHILSSEGYNGIGIDVRKRNIWDMYGSETKLIEETVTPSDRVLFSEYDWIIGNHSDELTPWIPVIAARSSYKMRVFLLPCCPFTFNGKYNRTHAGSSLYQSYLTFLTELCEVMGFNVQQDKLRIPSTKRACFICSSRNYELKDEDYIDNQRTLYIKKHSKTSLKVPSECQNFEQQNSNDQLNCKLTKAEGNVELTYITNPTESRDKESENELGSQKWSSDFKPRDSKEKVRNCTNLDQSLVNNIITRLANVLLSSGENYKTVATEQGNIEWNCGVTLSLGDLIKELDQDLLQILKHQCGGLQTLLRNHRNIFTVEKGHVTLTVPSTTEFQPRSNRKRKSRKIPQEQKRFSKSCWFYLHHPQGCILTSEECLFAHTNDNKYL